MTTYVGSLPPGGGNQDQTMNNAILNLLKNRFNQSVGGMGA